MANESQHPPVDDDNALEVISEAEGRFDRLRKRGGFYVAPLAFCLVLWFTRGRLPPDGNYLSAVLACVLVLWMSESLPLPATALLGACLCVVLGIADARTTLAPFADPIIFLLIGGFIISRSMAIHRLDRRFALAILSLRQVNGEKTRLLGAFGIVTAVVSMWVSNSAATAMMTPIALGIIHSLQEIRRTDHSQPHKTAGSAFSTGMMLMVAFSASVGGICTPVGSPTNLIGIGLIKKLAGVDVHFFQWMAMGIPLSVAMFGVLFVILSWLHRENTQRPQKKTGVSLLASYLQRERELLGGWTRGQINTLIALGMAILLWIVPGALAIFPGEEHGWAKFAEKNLPDGIVAIIAVCALFFLPVDRRNGKVTLTWREAAQIDWGTVLLMGGGMSLGGLMFSTGVAEAVGKGVTHLIGAQSLWGLTAVAIAMAIVVSETTSNSASANMVIPVAIALAEAAGVNPVPPALGACFGASFGFMLPVSTPPNAIVYGTGLIPLPKMIRAGVLFDLCGFLVIWLGLRVLCPLMGWG